MRRTTFTKAATRTLQRMPANQATLILRKVEQYARDPASLSNNVAKLQGRPGFRLRVNAWRVIFNEDHMVLAVLAIGPRSGVYDD